MVELSLLVGLLLLPFLKKVGRRGGLLFTVVHCKTQDFCSPWSMKEGALSLFCEVSPSTLLSLSPQSLLVTLPTPTTPIIPH